MIIIYKELIPKYISKLTPNHILQYAKSISFPITEEEARTLHSFILNHYMELMDSDQSLSLLRGQIREDLFKKIQTLYHENKIKYFS